MTRAEAVDYIKEWLKDEYALNQKDRIVLTMAIEALEVVMCKDCKRYESDGGALMTCKLTDMIADDYCYCWWGERRE